jgi:hypothetical protein
MALRRDIMRQAVRSGYLRHPGRSGRSMSVCGLAVDGVEFVDGNGGGPDERG